MACFDIVHIASFAESSYLDSGDLIKWQVRQVDIEQELMGHVAGSNLLRDESAELGSDIEAYFLDGADRDSNRGQSIEVPLQYC